MWYSAVRCIVMLTLSLLVVPLAAAQPLARMPRIGWLGVGVPPAKTANSLPYFLERLRELGYVEGQNLTMEYRWAEGKPERLPDLAAELVQLQVDVIIAPSTLATRAAQQTTTTIPIVMLAGDPVRAGFVASLARPRGNITGVSSQMSSAGGKLIELLREAVPTASRVTILWNPADQSNAVMWSEIQAGAHVLGVTLQSLEVRSAEQVERACAAMAPESADALIVFPSPLTVNDRQRIVETVAKHRLPAIYGFRNFVEAGGLMSYGVSFRELNRGMAVYVDKILKGAKPADLPAEQAMRFELVINLKTAEALGLTLPPHLLVFADKVMR